MNVQEKMFMTDYQKSASLSADFIRRQNAEYFRDQRETARIHVYHEKDGMLHYSIQRANKELVRPTIQRVFDQPCSCRVIMEIPPGIRECMILKFEPDKMIFVDEISTDFTVKRFKQILTRCGVSVCCTSKRVPDVLTETLAYLFESSDKILLPGDIGWMKDESNKWKYVRSTDMTYDKLITSIRNGNYTIYNGLILEKMEGGICKQMISM